MKRANNFLLEKNKYAMCAGELFERNLITAP